MRSPFARRRNRFSEAQQVALADWAERVENLPPCPDPGCIQARQEIRDICAGKPVR